VGAAAPLLIAPIERTYQADAVVVARQLTANPRVLPALAEAVFGDGAVVAAVAADPAVGGETRGVVPDKVSVVTGPNSITMVVQARDADPTTAARLADVAAAAFAAELNLGGTEVGQFAVQAPAIVPTAPLDIASDTLRAGLGALAGLALGLGLVALLAVLRRPCVTSRDISDAVGVPLLGSLELQRAAPGTYLGPRGARGIAPVTRWLATAPPGRLFLVSSKSATGTRQRVYVMVAIAMSTVRSLRLKAPGNLVDVIRQHSRHERDEFSAAPPHSGAGDELVLVDGGSLLEVVDPDATTASVVAVVPFGISRGRLRALCLDYMNAGLVGVILVKHRLGLRRRRGVAASQAPATRALAPVGGAPEPERV
jgi:hypothetical protein